MSPLQVGDPTPAVPTLPPGQGPRGLFFYKVTCPTCQMAAPTMARFEQAFPGRVVGIGQDPEPALARFTEEFRMGIASIEDAPPYAVSDAYAIESVPTLYLVDGATVLDAVGAWDRDGFNRVAAALAERLGAEPVLVSTPDDGLPQFQPG
jgi:thiol-disulfide isomerase/thioredoxin